MVRILASFSACCVPYIAITPSRGNMKLFVLATIAAFTRLSACQCTLSIPSCGQNCITEAVGVVGCEETDYACQCTNQDEIGANGASCLLSNCNANDLSKCPFPHERYYSVCYRIVISPQIERQRRSGAISHRFLLFLRQRRRGVLVD